MLLCQNERGTCQVTGGCSFGLQFRPPALGANPIHCESALDSVGLLVFTVPLLYAVHQAVYVVFLRGATTHTVDKARPHHVANDVAANSEVRRVWHVYHDALNAEAQRPETTFAARDLQQAVPLHRSRAFCASTSNQHAGGTTRNSKGLSAPSARETQHMFPPAFYWGELYETAVPLPIAVSLSDNCFPKTSQPSAIF